MTIRGYVLVEAEVGKAKAVAERIANLPPNGAKILSTDTLTGPYDVMVELQASDVDALGHVIGQDIQRVEGVEKTTTCLVVNLR